ncbi:BrnT family toxin [Rhodopseudomonas palustris]|uniref:BrnT family toxin n=1 Tax=Rhodopseudomonas palustris (strain BisB18) TaxID=316056 RepID=Q216J7_RHOPB
MVDLNQMTGFDWDPGNSRKSTDKHGISQAEAEQVFFNDPLIVADDVKHSTAEPRFNALGKTSEGRLLHVTFTLRQSSTLIRVISARAMNRKERTLYEKA